jgi:hypothetical protein
MNLPSPVGKAQEQPLQIQPGRLFERDSFLCICGMAKFPAG